MEKKHSVFIVDDDEFLLDMYSLKLRESGFEPEVSKSSVEALEKMRGGFKPDVILLDLVMPKMDGFEVLTAIKEEKLEPDALVVILTNLGQQEDIQKGKKLGADDYIIKAYFTPTEVVGKIQDLLSKK